jgi:protein-disulfide isomerase/uncharacterized membrane protein
MVYGVDADVISETPGRERIAVAPRVGDPVSSTRILTFATVCLGFVGVFIAAVLSTGELLELPVLCGASRGCATVSAHASSKLLGVPIALIGLVAYGAYLALIGRSVVGRRARLAAVVLTGCGTVVSAGLLLYSQTVIHATCSWCVASAATMTALFLLSSRLLKGGSDRAGARPGTVWTLGILTALAIGVQAGRMELAATKSPVSAKQLARFAAGQLVDPVKSVGPQDAGVTIIVFADFMCPACRAALHSLQQFQNAHPRNVRLGYRHLPLTEIRGHEMSKAAAAVSEMAGERGRFWVFADALHADPARLNGVKYLELMQQLELDPAVVQLRLADIGDRAIANVVRDLELARELGIQATPTFIVQIGTEAPVSATPRGLARLLNSAKVTSWLSHRTHARLTE